MTKPLEVLINRAKHIVESGGLLARDTSLALIAALEQSKQHAKDRDAENQDLIITISRLRSEIESHIKEIVEDGVKFRGLNVNIQGLEENLVSQLELEQCESLRKITRAKLNATEAVVLALRDDVRGARGRIAYLEKYAEAEASGADETADNVLYWMRRCKELEDSKLPVKLNEKEFEIWVNNPHMTGKKTTPEAWGASKAVVDEWKRNPYEHLYTRGAYDMFLHLRTAGITVQGDE